jgi:hypothetical protein
MEIIGLMGAGITTNSVHFNVVRKTGLTYRENSASCSYLVCGQRQGTQRRTGFGDDLFRGTTDAEEEQMSRAGAVRRSEPGHGSLRVGREPPGPSALEPRRRSGHESPRNVCEVHKVIDMPVTPLRSVDIPPEPGAETARTERAADIGVQPTVQVQASELSDDGLGIGG